MNGLSWVVIYVFGSKPNQSKAFMYGLGHGFRFIDPIKIELNRSKVLELFGLSLNPANIGTTSIGTS